MRDAALVLAVASLATALMTFLICRPAWARRGAWVGLALLLAGSWIGLVIAPAERHMGDVQRIMYVHVPSAWIALLSFVVAFALAIVSLWTGEDRWDDRLVGAVEVGCVLNALLLVQGSIWGRATWGVWWDWDVRLTTSLVMLLLFVGVLALRRLADDEGRRARWSAVATIVAFVDVPLVYFCVRWWRSLHQIQSSPETMDPAMALPLRLNAAAVLLLAAWLASWRGRIEAVRRAAERAPLPARQAQRGASLA
ncbi:MAG: cytochrome c biogenesis protein [Thermoanaerobaculia bacterium]